MIGLGYLQLKPWELAAYTLRSLLIAYEGWKQVNMHAPWERTRILSFYIGNHKASTPEELFHLEIDQIRLKDQIKKGKIEFATARKQTPEEQELIRQILARK